MKEKWKKFLLILLLPFMIFIEGCSCSGDGEVTSSQTFLVHFYMGGQGETDPLQIKDQTIVYGGTITKPVDPVWKDHYLEGWYTDMECTNRWDFANDKVKEEVHLYAKWVGQFTVQFNLHSTSCTPAQITNGYIVEGHKIAEPDKPTWKGYDFAGWYLDAEFTSPWNFYDDVVTSHMTLHAKWVKKK